MRARVQTTKHEQRDVGECTRRPNTSHLKPASRNTNTNNRTQSFDYYFISVINFVSIHLK